MPNRASIEAALVRGMGRTRVVELICEKEADETFYALGQPAPDAPSEAPPEARQPGEAP